MNWEEWDKIAESQHRKSIIHPSGVSPELYLSSGEEMANIIMQHYKKEMVVLEYGCGDGRVLRFIRGKKIGVDTSAKMLSYIDFDAEVCLSSHLAEFQSMKVDLIYTVTCFIHMKLADSFVAFQNLCTHMKPGGIFLFDQPVYSVAKENTAWNDISCWDNKMFHEQTERAGLTVLEFHPSSVPFQWGVSIGEKHGSFHVLQKS